MERSAGRVLVFSKVIGIEFLEGGVLFIHRNQLGYQCTIRNKMDLDTYNETSDSFRTDRLQPPATLKYSATILQAQKLIQLQ